MSLWLIIALIVVLAIVLGGIWFAVQELNEFEKAFNYGVMVLLFLIVGGAIYLAFASPSFATKETPKAGNVIEQETNLLLE